MCSVVAFQNSHLKSKTTQFYTGRRRCGDVSISSDVKYLTLHCIFCEFNIELDIEFKIELNMFLNHLKSNHLSLVSTDFTEMSSSPEIQEIETETENLQVKLEILEVQDAKIAEDIKSASENDPLMTEENSQKTDDDKFTMKVSICLYQFLYFLVNFWKMYCCTAISDQIITEFTPLTKTCLVTIFPCSFLFIK